MSPLRCHGSARFLFDAPLSPHRIQTQPLIRNRDAELAQLAHQNRPRVYSVKTMSR